ncbi:MAG TPA: NfeD family protein [Kiritimatiellia bacterium]|nr:NfeD family protein [Kiritimatiellia bacterium]
MSGDLQTYILLIVGGLLLIGFEFFLPGGILGLIGVVALLIAMAVGFGVFGAAGGMLSALGIIVGTLILVALWIKYCPKTKLGRMFTLQEDGVSFKSMDESSQALMGVEGSAHTDLRPAGMAMLEGKRVDVVSESGYVEKGTVVKVIRVDGNRIVVRAMVPG